MKKIIDLPTSLKSKIDALPGTASANILRILEKNFDDNMPYIYDVKEIDLTKLMFLMILSDNRYYIEHINHDLHFKFKRKFGENSISFVGLNGLVGDIEINFDVESGYDLQVIVDTFQARFINNDMDVLKLLTISEKIKLIPPQWKDDIQLLHLIENNYSNYL